MRFQANDRRGVWAEAALVSSWARVGGTSLASMRRSLATEPGSWLRRWSWLAALTLAGCASVAQEGDADAATRAAAEAPATVGDEANGPALDPEAELAQASEAAQQEREELARDRQALQIGAWSQVKAIAEIWGTLPADVFPGLTGLAGQVEALRQEIETEDRLLIGRIDPEALTRHNPVFWRAVLETTASDPMMAVFEQMIWAARGHFDHANWLVELNRYGPALPNSVYRLVYAFADEMRSVRARVSARDRVLFDSLEPEEVPATVAALLSFQPDNADYHLTNVLLRLGAAGVPSEEVHEHAEVVTPLLVEMEPTVRYIALSNPLVGARLNPDPIVRSAAFQLTGLLNDLQDSRGAFGRRDLERLAAELEAAGLRDEALFTYRRAAAMRGFSVPSDWMPWWRILPDLIGAEEASALRTAWNSGEIAPVSFYDVGDQEAEVPTMPLHPIMQERAQRALVEASRRLEKPNVSEREMAFALVTRAEHLGHLGRWDEASAALEELPEAFKPAGAMTGVWLAIWSGRLDELDEKVAAIDARAFELQPSLPALARAAQGDWTGGADLFAAGAERTEVDLEHRAYYTMMAAVFARLGGDDVRADDLIARANAMVVDADGLDWVKSLARGMAGEQGMGPVGTDITEVVEAGRICEQRFYRAFAAGVPADEQQLLLEACLITGVVDFVEYTASMLRLREIEPERWDPTQVPELPPAPVRDSDDDDDDDTDWTDEAAPFWSLPS